MSELEVDLPLDGDVHGTLPQLRQYQPSGPWIQGPTDGKLAWKAVQQHGSCIFLERHRHQRPSPVPVQNPLP